jgi:aromatic-L-amino-acid/L-tryptophan decarboxylase
VIARVASTLQDFTRFEGRDPAARQREKWLSHLDQPLPQQAAGLDAVIDELTSVVIPYGLRNGAPGFSGWITTAPTTSATAATLASAVAGSQRWWVQSFNYLETVALRWLGELLGLPATMQGAFTSGGSVANLVALGAARQHAFERSGHDPALDGLKHGYPWAIYASSEVHHVVTRASAVLGLGRRSVVPIATDEGGRISVVDLHERLRRDIDAGVTPIALVATAGTVNTGAVDPITDMAELASEYGIWLHVDGAYGLFGKLDPEVESLFDGVERADSVAVDPHKWMAAPVGCGAVFVRDRVLMGRAFTLEPAEYLEGSVEGPGEIQSPFDDLGEQFHDFQVEQSAPSRGVAVWAILKEIGAEGIRDRVRRHNSYARRVAELASQDEQLEVLSEPTLSICCFRFNPGNLPDLELDAVNADIARRLRAERDLVPSTTRVRGLLAIRPCYINPRATVDEVDRLVRSVKEIGREVVSH